MTKFCTQCGTSLTDGMKFCGQCGTAVAAIDTQAQAQDSPTLDTKPSSPAIGGWLLVMCIYLIFFGALGLLNISSLDNLGFVAVLQTLIPAFGLLCGVMLLLKKSPWIHITKIYFGLSIFGSAIVVIMSMIAIFAFVNLNGISIWQVLIVLCLFIPLAISIGFFRYISLSTRVRNTFPNDFK